MVKRDGNRIALCSRTIVWQKLGKQVINIGLELPICLNNVTAACSHRNIV